MGIEQPTKFEPGSEDWQEQRKSEAAASKEHMEKISQELPDDINKLLSMRKNSEKSWVGANDSMSKNVARDSISAIDKKLNELGYEEEESK
jgi:type VI protein secretion system component VasF